eukprot:PhF_6_TR6753/c0_g1_i1/m.9754
MTDEPIASLTSSTQIAVKCVPDALELLRSVLILQPHLDSKIESLTFESSQLLPDPDRACLVLADILVLCHPTALNLGNTKLTSLSCASLGKHPHGLHSLVKLDVGCNDIGPDGAALLAEALSDSPSLEVLCIGANRIGDVGCAAVAHYVVRSSQSLREVSMEVNGITSRGVTVLSRCIPHCPTLKRISLWHNVGIDDAGGVALAEKSMMLWGGGGGANSSTSSSSSLCCCVFELWGTGVGALTTEAFWRAGYVSNPPGEHIYIPKRR